MTAVADFVLVVVKTPELAPPRGRIGDSRKAVAKRRVRAAMVDYILLARLFIYDRMPQIVSLYKMGQLFN